MFDMERARVVGVPVTTTPKVLERRRAKLERRDGRHSWSYAKVSRKLIPILGEYTPNDETIRRYHTTAATDPIVLAAVCELYDLTLEDVDPAAYEVLLRVSERIDKWCGIDLRDQPTPSSSCNADRWGERPKLFDDEVFFAPTTNNHYSKAS